jgi:D-inositol-3-phosphate glycosyltransferase
LDEARRRWTTRVTTREWTDDYREIARAYLGCHCVVVPSYVEPFGLVALEALAGGCYLLTSDAGGLPEIAEDVPCASVYPRGDLGRLEAHLSDFITGGKWRDMRTTKCAHKVRQRFSVDQMADAYHNLYRTFWDK